MIGADGCQLNGFTLRNGKARYGGGIFLDKAGMTIKNNTIEDNVADHNGGGLYISGYPGTTKSGIYFDIENNVIQKNEAAGYKGGLGGGMFVTDSRAGIRINDNTIGGKPGDGNKAKWGGGGIWIEDTPIIDIAENEISQNITDGHGGGVVIHGGSGNSSLRENKIHYNLAYGNYGGGVYVIGGTFVSKNSITGNRIDNRSLGRGGGIAVSCLDHLSPVLENNFINNNFADYGAGIHMHRADRILIINNSVAFNRANPDLKAGGGVHVVDGRFVLQNNILWGNKDDLRVVTGSSILIHNDIEDGDGFGKLGNISSDPKFVDQSDLHITSTSGAINAGDPAGGPKDDIDGQRRSLTTPDIGADEFMEKE